MQTLQKNQISQTAGQPFRVTTVVGFLFLCSLIVVSVGCKKAEEIRHIVVDADKSGIVFGRSVRPAANVGEPTDRMVVGIHETSSKTWTFKISGPIAEVTRAEPQWLEFLRGVTFDGEGSPVWQMPDGWKKAEIKPSPFAPFARLQITDSLNMSVSQLPARMDLLSNVNRWHNQLSLPPARTVDLQLIGGDSKVPFQMFDQVGSLGGGGGMMRPPGRMPPMSSGGTSGGTGSASGSSTVGAGSDPTESPIEYDVPEGWSGQASPVAAASFLVGDGDAVARVAITKMPGLQLNSWGQVSANWAAEVGLDPKEIDFAAESQDLLVDELPGKMIAHISDDDEIEGGLIGIRVTRGDDAWFIKMTGPKEVVSKSQEDFIQFAKSLRFKPE